MMARSITNGASTCSIEIVALCNACVVTRDNVQPLAEHPAGWSTAFAGTDLYVV
jgi:hypothetical protein